MTDKAQLIFGAKSKPLLRFSNQTNRQPITILAPHHLNRLVTELRRLTRVIDELIDIDIGQHGFNQLNHVSVRLIRIQAPLHTGNGRFATADMPTDYRIGQ